MSTNRNPLTLLADDSDDSGKAINALRRAKLRFVTVPAEGPGPLLFSQRGTFSGLDGVQSYIIYEAQKRKQQAAQEE